MDLNLSESEELVHSSVREFLAAEVTTEVVAATEQANEFPRDLWKRLAAGRWFGIGVPEDRGGEGGSLVEWSIVLQELGRVACPGPVVEQLAAARFLANTDRAGQVASGAEVVSLGIQDQPGDPVSARESSGGAGVLNGTKILVPYGRAADKLLVAAPLDAVPHYWEVAGGAAGLESNPIHSVTRDQQAVVSFSDAAASALGSGVAEPGQKSFSFVAF